MHLDFWQDQEGATTPFFAICDLRDGPSLKSESASLDRIDQGWSY